MNGFVNRLLNFHHSTPRTLFTPPGFYKTILKMIQCRNALSRLTRRSYATVSASSAKFQSVDPSKYKLTCGLEIHAQLMTPQKLFSSQDTGSLHAPVNSQVSYYDAALPGTQPILNPNNIYLGLRAAVALGCDIAPRFSFDRKHYFYGDQPAGYQITQHFEPFATNGALTLYNRDLDDGRGVGKKTQKNDGIRVRLLQIQIEQDTGKSSYIDDTANIDLNRTNHCLIELVTLPDIPTPEAAGVFVKKLQQLLSHLGVCTGELESGAMRVDVNVSVSKKNKDAWESGERCEIKNLSTTSAVVHAIRAEFTRQVQDIEEGKVIERETRGWDGRKTWKLRSKEDGVDYRYMPDPEVLPVVLGAEVVESIKNELPQLPDDILKTLLEAPYNVPLRDARTLMTGSAESHGEDSESTEGSSTTKLETTSFVLGQTGSLPLVEYYIAVFKHLADKGAKTKLAANWIVHTLLGELNVLGRTSFVEGVTVPPALQLADMLVQISERNLTTASGKLILKHLLQNPAATATHTIADIMNEFELSRAPTEEPTETSSSPSTAAGDDVREAILEICQGTVDKFPKIVDQITSGKKPKSIQFLIGQVMRETQGRVDPLLIEQVFNEILQK